MAIDSNKKLTGITDQAGREASISAFGLLKVANESIIEAFRYTSDDITANFDETATGLGDWSVVNSSSLQLNTGAQTSSSISLYSKKAHNYKPGLGILSKISIMLGDSGVAGNTREWGLRDGDNGVFVRLNGDSGYEFVLLSDGVETVVSSANWDIPVTPDDKGHLWYIQYQWLGVGNYYLYYDEQLVYVHEFLGTSNVVSMEVPDLKMYFSNENTTNSTDVNFKSGCSVISMEGGNTISGIDDNGVVREVAVSATRRLLVSQEPPTPPPSTTSVVRSEYSSMSGSVDTIYTITSGKTLVIQRLSAGFEFSNAGKAVELYEDPNGDLSVLNVIDVIMGNGNSDQHDLNATYDGDGTRRIVMRRRMLSGGSELIFGRWEGYEQTT